ncbi:MAG: hypothetical protein QOI31_2015 [Solirubrobacterales bacterium]|jgi:hypothetical protein|nr:hypothetical protein [Solirubrobacterales bacterium]
MHTQTTTMSPQTVKHITAGVVHYDDQARRVWVGTQRLHHGLVGTLFAAAGVALMAHDWHDRKVWFMRGPQND